ncbi:MAG: hypothetical protein LBR67_08025 [Dysgonamonadaceae bacterium]|jgi:hypothetical protein|nr:hypothetical protein [Dysgonamonadaceae bacterium]
MKLKLLRYKYGLFALLVVWMTTCGSSDEDPDDPNENPTEEDGVKYVKLENQDFETEINFADGSGVWKRVNFSNANDVQVEWSKTGGYENSGCIKITALPANGKVGVGVSQKITNLKPNTLYRFTAKVKISDVADGRGANLFTSSTGQIWNSSEFQLGTNLTWKSIFIDFISEKDGTAELICGLGFRYGGTSSGGMATGVVWYDEVRLIEVQEELLVITGEYVDMILMPKTAAPYDPDKLKNWVAHLDEVYQSYETLIGDRPYGGAKIRVLSTYGIESGYWALAGNPILWNANYVNSTLQEISTYDNWVFGIMHEMGHVFNTGNFEGKYQGAWNWNDEMFANFRMYYALTQHEDSYVYINSKLYKSAEISAMYEDVYKTTLQIGLKNSGDGLMFVLIRLSEQLGWEAYRKAFQDMYKNSPVNFSSNWLKFRYLLDTLQKYTVLDVYSLIPESELETIRQSLD